jgi:hypothetical protein
MRKLIFIVLTILSAVLVFSIIIFLFSQNKSKGALQVTSNPNSKVFLDGKLIGKTPFRTNNLKDMIFEGEYTIKLIPVSGNFQDFEQKITISPGVLTVVDKTFAGNSLDSASITTLTQINNRNDAQISVMTFPQNTQVFLDNNLQGQSPILLKNITKSDHELKVTKEGYKDKILMISTELGFKLEAVMYLGLDPNISTISAKSLVSSPTKLVDSPKVLILSTPTGFLRVRQDSSISSLEITQIKPGETYVLLDEKTNWYKIQLTDGKAGWISSQYAEKVN